jgi:hypothetical protein
LFLEEAEGYDKNPQKSMWGTQLTEGFGAAILKEGAASHVSQSDELK